MKKLLITLITIICTISTFSQTNGGNELTAEGNAKIKVKPDLANFHITVTKQNTVEKTAIKDLNQEIEKLQNVLLKIGFTEKNVKIADYKVSKNDYNNRNEISVVNTLSIDFVLDNKIIESFYQEIQNENLQDLEIDFQSNVSEGLEKITRQKLVQTAIQNAKENAENIAKALDVKLNNVKQVSKYLRDSASFSYMKTDQVKFLKPVISKTEDVNPKTSFDKFEVVDVELEETITIVYEITKK